MGDEFKPRVCQLQRPFVSKVGAMFGNYKQADWQESEWKSEKNKAEDQSRGDYVKLFAFCLLISLEVTEEAGRGGSSL